MKEVIKYDHGQVFATNAISAAYIFLVVGIFVTLVKPFLGIPFILFALFILLTKYGVEINLNLKLLKEYSLLIGFIKIGKWQTISDYKYVTVMPSKTSSTAHSRSGRVNTETNYFQSVMIFKGKLKGKIEIARFDSHEKAKTEAQKIASKMGFEYFKYSPDLARKKMTSN